MKQDIDAVLHQFFSRRNASAILVAYSGGPDSAALLHALARMSLMENRFSVKACWINHALRSKEEMQAEQALIEQFAERLAVPLIVVTAVPGAIEACRRELGVSGGIEAAARAFRYKKLYETAKTQHCDTIATAHTKTDVLETLIMRFLTGSGIEGLCGIPEEQGNIVRPFLTVTRETVLDYINTWDIPVSHDSTNQETIYLRNKIRHKLIPVIKDSFPDYASSLETLQEKVRFDASALTAYAQKLVSAGVQGVSEMVLDRNGFFESPLAVQIRALYLLLRRQRQRIPWYTMKQLATDLSSHGKAQLGAITLAVHGNYICIQNSREKSSRTNKELFFSFLVDGSAVFRIGNRAVLAVEFSQQGPGLRKDAVTMPFVIRSPKKGDTIQRKEGRKSVEAIIATWKLSLEEQSLVIVLEDIDGVVAVWGEHIGKKTVFRHNLNLLNSYDNDYITVTMKGVDNE